MSTSFGKLLRLYRKKNGDALLTLASKLEISSPYLSSMEVGRRTIPMEVIEKIRNLYSLSEEKYDEL